MGAPIIGIYKITSPSGKIYIGQSVNIAVRFDKYRLLHCRGQVRLYSSFKAYGVDQHVFEVIETCAPPLLNERERHYQEYYDSAGDNGLNCKVTKAPGRSGYHSQQTRNNISKGKMGKKCSASHLESLKRGKQNIKPETREKIRRANIGKKLSDTTIEKMRARMVGNKYTAGVVPVNAKKVVDIVTGVVYDSSTIAADANKMKARTLVAMLTGQNSNKTNLKYL